MKTDVAEEIYKLLCPEIEISQPPIELPHFPNDSNYRRYGPGPIRTITIKLPGPNRTKQATKLLKELTPDLYVHVVIEYD